VVDVVDEVSREIGGYIIFYGDKKGQHNSLFIV
jgi:hypothetical protein